MCAKIKAILVTSAALLHVIHRHHFHRTQDNPSKENHWECASFFSSLNPTLSYSLNSTEVYLSVKSFSRRLKGPTVHSEVIKEAVGVRGHVAQGCPQVTCGR